MMTIYRHDEPLRKVDWVTLTGVRAGVAAILGVTRRRRPPEIL